MVLARFANTTIKEDLLHISNTFSKIKLEELDELPMVDVIINRLGLDDVNGKYVVLGGVVFNKITVKLNKAGSGTIEGYHIGRLECDSEGKVVLDSNFQPKVVESLCISKEEGLALTQFMGNRNAYIRSMSVGAKQGTEALKKITHLQPHPRKTQAFLKGDRVVYTYLLDEFGARVYPLTLALKEDSCSGTFWKLVYADYKKKQQQSKNKVSNSKIRKVQQERISQIKKDVLIKNTPIFNPFQK